MAAVVAAAKDVPPYFGSGIAAKQFDSGAPFFVPPAELTGFLKAKTLLVGRGGSTLFRRSPAYLFGLPGGLSALKTSLFFSMKEA